VRLKLALMLGGLGLLGIGDEEQPGWLARALASTDADVDASIEAYEDEDYEAASERLDAAVARRGERAELYYNRGLILVATGDLEGARALFQNGTLSEHPQVQASSHYQLGNLALAQEDWEGAIAAFSECLRIQPDHHNAKWNLELALLRKQEQEKKEQEEQEKKEQEEKEEQEEQDQQEQEQDQQEQEEQGEEEKEDQQDQGEQEQDQKEQGEDGEQEQQDQQEQDQQQQDQQQQDQGEQQGEQQQREQQQAQPVEGGDLDAALDELDRQDAFMFGRPRGAGRKVEKDW
jgi:Ca-activated chloride channel family protein